VYGSAAEKAATVNSSSSLSESDVSYTDGALGDVLDFLAKPLLTSKRRGDGETVSGFALSEWVVTTLCVSTRDATVSYLAFMVYGLWFMVYGLWFMVSGQQIRTLEYRRRRVSVLARRRRLAVSISHLPHSPD
jgi:hypothetical protein